MSNLQSANPFEISVKDVTIEKFNGSDRMSILPQFIEVDIYQGVFSPLMRASMMIYDPIGMFVNYPLSAEEIIRIEIGQTSSGKVTKNVITVFPFNEPLGDNSTIRLSFMIASITEITPSDQGRASAYILNLVGLEMYEVARMNVSQFYKGPFDTNAEELWQEYVINPVVLRESERVASQPQYVLADGSKRFYLNDETIGKGKESTDGLVIPNINAIQAMGLLGKYTITEQTPEVYCNNVFFENFYGYFFTTIQSLIQDQLRFANQMRNKERYLYTSNIETIKKSATTEAEYESQMNRMISNISINNRYTTLDKISGGYYLSELYEINPTQKRHFSSKLKLTETDLSGYLHPNNVLNNSRFIEESEKNLLSETLQDEISSHIKYEVVLANDIEYDLRRLKYHSATKYLHALNSVDVTITVPPDLGHNCGEVIYCELPEMHGFDIIRDDPYISGFFFVTEVKHSISAGGRAATTLRIQKDSLRTKLGPFKYSLSSGDDRSVTNPSTGEKE
jgi:hypothetical protein